MRGYTKEFHRAKIGTDEPNLAGSMSAPVRQEHLERAAQCWCAPSTSMIEMDMRLAEVFAQALADAAADERERCAKAAEDFLSDRKWGVGDEIAAAIRAAAGRK